MKISDRNGEVDLTDTVPDRFLGGPVTVAIQNLGVSDPAVLVFPGNVENVSQTKNTFYSSESEFTGYVRLSGFPLGVYPDLTQLRRVDGKALTAHDFENVVQSLGDDGFILFTENVIRITLDEDDEWLARS